MPPNGTVSQDVEFKIGEMRGPKHLDFRKRWGWIFFDLVHADGTKVHLQAFLKLSRSGVVDALLGRTDLDSTVEKPQSSGQVGTGTVDGMMVTFVVDETLRDLQNVVDDSTKKGVRELIGKGVETSSFVSHQLARASLMVGSEARYHEYAIPVPPSRVGSLRHSVHEVAGLATRYIGAFVEHDGKGWWNGHVKVGSYNLWASLEAYMAPAGPPNHGNRVRPSVLKTAQRRSPSKLPAAKARDLIQRPQPPQYLQTVRS